MRWIFIFLIGCSSGGIPSNNNSDLGQIDLAQAGDLAGGPPAMCVSTCNRCNGGGCCGTICCNTGEWCDASQHCRCGTNVGCATGLQCATGGPVSPDRTCGSVCCGDAMHPCPL